MKMRGGLVLERKQVGIDAKGEPIMAYYVLDGNLYFKVVEKSSRHRWKRQPDARSATDSYAQTHTVRPQFRGRPQQASTWRYP